MATGFATFTRGKGDIGAVHDSTNKYTQYDFLLHSMLGLGASHLGLLTPSGYEKAALKHRVTAIGALNKHLTKPCFTQQDAEAAFGAMLNLTFQSAYMAEGLIDFLTMVRGCMFF